MTIADTARVTVGRSSNVPVLLKASRNAPTSPLKV